MANWQLQKAKACFSEVVNLAKTKGPQKITVRGEPAVVIISVKEYEKLTKPIPSLVSFIKQSPLAGLELDFERNRSLTRDVDL